jgi:hypothetical protein
MSLTHIDQNKWIFSINNSSKINSLTPLKSILQNTNVGLVQKDFSPTVYNTLKQELIRIKAIPADPKTSSASFLISFYQNGYFLLRKLKPIKSNNSTLIIIDLKFKHCPLMKTFHSINFPSLYFAQNITTNSPFSPFDQFSGSESDDIGHNTTHIHVNPSNNGYCEICDMGYHSAEEHRNMSCHRLASLNPKMWEEVDSCLGFN